MSTDVKAASFVYLNHVFILGSLQNSMSLINNRVQNGKDLWVLNIEGYEYSDFYKAAALIGGEKHNTFFLDGLEVMPCETHFISFR